MGVFEQFPYANMHEMNLDWLLKKMKELIQAMETFKATESLKFADPIIWDITTQYQKSTIVLDPTGNAYLSLQAVPAGAQLNNDEYWLEIFNFTDYTRTANKNLTVNVETNTTRATADYQVDDWLIWNDVLYKVTSPIAIDDALIVAPDAGSNIVHFTVEDFLKAFITYVNGIILQYKNDIDASELAFTSNLQQQFDQVIAGVTVDSEVINARLGWDNFNYTTLRDCINTTETDIISISENNIRASITGDYFAAHWQRGTLGLSDGVESADNRFLRTPFMKFDFPITLHLDSNYNYHWIRYNPDGTYVGYSGISDGATIDATEYLYRFRMYKSSLADMNISEGNSFKYSITGIKDPFTLESLINAQSGEILNSADIDTLMDNGIYRIRTVSGTLPDDYFASDNVFLHNINVDGWVIQRAFTLTNPEFVFSRYIRISNNYHSPWTKVDNWEVYYKGLINIPSHNIFGWEQGTISLSDGTLSYDARFIRTGPFTIESPIYIILSNPDYRIDFVRYNKSDSTYAGYGGFGSASGVIDDPTYIYRLRILRNDLTNITPEAGGVVEYQKIPFDVTKLAGKNILFFGDSIVANFQPPIDIPTMIEKRTGAKVYNVAFGGCEMSDHNQARWMYSMCRLADAIYSNNFYRQDESYSGIQIDYARETSSGYVATGIDYVQDRVNILKNIDWSHIDYVFIMYGTNDWVNNVPLDNPNNPTDQTTYLGAFRYSVEKILSVHPNVKIVPITPIWRWWDQNTGWTTAGDSDTWAPTSGTYLYQFAEGLIEACKKYHLTPIDLYYHCEFNQQNKYQYFFTNDGTHPFTKGRQLLSDKISNVVSDGIAY